MSSNNYNILIKKLDGFIRKYYTNQLLKGILFTTAILLVFFLTIILGEYFFYFSSAVRKIMFYGFLGLGLITSFLFIVLPLLKIYKLGVTISYTQAADIIGKHFRNVEDKLLNILQLKQASISLADASLVEASINQKSTELKPVPFVSAIDFSNNKQYLKYTLPPLLLLFAILFFKPRVITDSTNRLFNNNIQFEKPMPFQFIVNTDSLEVMQYEDFKLNVKIEGDEIPAEVFIVKNNIKQNIQKLNTTNFAYIFTNLQKDEKFHLEANGFSSKDFTLSVLEKPMITKFEVQLDYPNYTLQKDDIIKNSGDLSVPEGTKIKWLFDAIATDSIFMQFSAALFSLEKSDRGQFFLHKSLNNSDKYIVIIKNNTAGIVDSSQFNISVILDQFPQISVEEYQDSANLDQYFYIGKISDDYGIKALNFSYQIIKENPDSTNSNYITESIPFEKGVISEFNFYWNLRELHLKPGDKLNYFFTVWDNDGVNGSKSARSKWMTYAVPSIDEFEEKNNEDFDKIKQDLKDNIKESKELQEDLKKFQQKMIDKKELEWQDKKELEDLLAKQKSLQNSIESIEKRMQENMQEQAEFKKVDPEIQKKQEQVQALMDDILDDETKALMEKLEKMLEEMERDDAMEELAEMEMNDEELEKELDRMLELLKKLEFEQKLQESVDELEKLAEEQENLSEKANDKNEEAQKLKEEQDKLNDEFDKLSDELDVLSKMNEELDGLEDMSDLQEESEDLQKEMEESSDELRKGQKQKAGEKQKDSAEKMKEMAQKLASMMQSAEMSQMEEDMESLRQLLENLVVLSFEEERLLDEFKITTTNTPKFISLIQEQHDLIDDSKTVEDSLFALAKRVFQIESFITDEILEINRNLEYTVNELEDRRVSKAIVNQQYVMTGYNNLALMLSEVMQQMQQQMAQKMDGNQQCENPGSNPGAKPGKIPSLKEMQQQLNDQINEMGEMMKEGQKAGQKPGMSSQKMAQMAAKQQAIRQALEKIKQSEGENSEGGLSNLQEMIDEMQKTETDLVNKLLTNEMLERQKDIMVKLLEAETAEQQRDEKDERKSNTANQIVKETPPSLEQYLKEREVSIEMYRSLPPQLKPYYKGITEKYFKNISTIE